MAPVNSGWFQPPSPGDIVWCRFPERGIPEPGPKARPALVLAIGETARGSVAVVAYGTSRKVDPLYAGEFRITVLDGPAFEVSGLSASTKFNLARTSELDYNDVWFAVPPGAPQGQTPKLGILHPNLVRRAKAAYDAARRARR